MCRRFRRCRPSTRQPRLGRDAAVDRPQRRSRWRPTRSPRSRPSTTCPPRPSVAIAPVDADVESDAATAIDGPTRSRVCSSSSRRVRRAVSYSLGEGPRAQRRLRLRDSDYPQPGGARRALSRRQHRRRRGLQQGAVVLAAHVAQFPTGTSAVSDDRADCTTASSGNVQLTREIGRTWSAASATTASVGFVETFRAPVLSTTRSTPASAGLISRTVQFRPASAPRAATWALRPNNGYQSTSCRPACGTRSSRPGFERLLRVLPLHVGRRHRAAAGRRAASEPAELRVLRRYVGAAYSTQQEC